MYVVTCLLVIASSCLASKRIEVLIVSDYTALQEWSRENPVEGSTLEVQMIEPTAKLFIRQIPDTRMNDKDYITPLLTETAGPSGVVAYNPLSKSSAIVTVKSYAGMQVYT